MTLPLLPPLAPTTAAASPACHVRPARRVAGLLDGWEPVTTRVGLALAVLSPVLVLAGAMDVRAVAGDPVWTKPVKFALAFSIYLLTLGFFGRFVDRAWRRRIGFKVPVLAGASAIVMEQAIVTLQSARGVGSHFNVATPLDAGLYAAMGVGSLVLTAMTLPVAWGVARARSSRLDGGIRSAIVMGLVLTFVLTLATAGTMAVLGGHQVGDTTGPLRTLAPMGWLRDVGDLRVPHFFATHAMHALPLLAWGIARARADDRRAAVLGAAFYVVAVGIVFAQALAGRPLLALGGM